MPGWCTSLAAGMTAALLAAPLAVPAAAVAAPCASPCVGLPRLETVDRLLWSAGLETGDLSAFHVYDSDRVGSPGPTVVDDPAVARDGRYAVAFPVPPGGNRNEIVPRLRLLRPGDDLWFAFSTGLAPGFPVDRAWQVVSQWKNQGEGSPPLELTVADGAYQLSGGFGHPDGPRRFSRPLGAAVAGRWDDWIVHVRFSADPTAGSVEVWRNGTLALPSFAPPGGTLYPGAASYLKVGYYRNPQIDVAGTLVMDSLRVGTTAAAVARPAG
jgi:hypothetical protein